MATVTRADFASLKEAVDLEEFARAHLQPGRARNTYVCPLCGSGTGPHGTAALTVKEGKWKCFACQAGGDVFDLAAAALGIGAEDKAGQLQAVAGWAGIPTGDSVRGGAGSKPKADRWEAPSYRREAPRSTREATEPAILRDGTARHAAYVKACQEAMTEGCGGMAYMLGRGFTADEVCRFGIGWDAARARVVVPYDVNGGGSYHVDRATSDADKGARYRKPPTAEVGKEPLFHGGNLTPTGRGTCFVVEGQIDAMAVEACGHLAVALGGVGASGVVEAAGAVGYRGTLAVMLDRDETGEAQAADVVEKLKAVQTCGVMVAAAEGWPDGIKDAAEWLQRDRDGLRTYLDGQAKRAIAESFTAYWDAMRCLGAADSGAVLDAVLGCDVDADPIPTGIGTVDAVLGGGLRPGALYALGAISSMGKTTFALQVADYIAAQGRPVLYVTMEQSAAEMVAKSLTRIVRALYDGPAVTERHVMSKAARVGLTQEAMGALLLAADVYNEAIAPWLVYLESPLGRGTTALDVNEAARRIEGRTGLAPVVFVDYLQLMAPADDAGTRREATDRNVMALKQVARDLNAPVVAITSLNRAAYYGPVDLDSYKESGGIEYSADVLMGLQPYGMRDKYDGAKGKTDGAVKQEMAAAIHATKAAAERHLELSVIKQRGGRAEGAAELAYVPAANAMYGGSNAPAPGRATAEADYVAEYIEEHAGACDGDDCR